MQVKNLTKKELANKIYKNLGFSKNFSSLIIDDFIEFIINGLITSNRIKISSFGTFIVLNKKERMGRNPKTKASAKICARKIVKFKPSEIIKNRLNYK